jgi:hypothetical protein
MFKIRMPYIIDNKDELSETDNEALENNGNLESLDYLSSNSDDNKSTEGQNFFTMTELNPSDKEDNLMNYKNSTESEVPDFIPHYHSYDNDTNEFTTSVPELVGYPENRSRCNYVSTTMLECKVPACVIPHAK